MALPAVIENVNLPAVLSPEKTRKVVEANLLGFQGRLKFGIIRVPAGGGKHFDTGDEDEARKELIGVIVDHHPNNVYWELPFEQRKAGPPDCWSVDGLHGEGDPGGLCQECELNQFGSGAGGKGKACANRHRIYVLQEGCFLPDLLNLPVMSVQSFMAYVVKLSKHGLLFNEVVTRITLEQATNKDGIAYSRTKFSVAGILPENIKAKMQAYTEEISKYTRVKPVAEEFAPVSPEEEEVEDERF